MGRTVQVRWNSEDLGFTAKSRKRECEYAAYVPDTLSGRSFAFSGECAADIAEAEAAIRGLNATAEVLVATEGLARLLLRAEASASSRIEGIVVDAGRLLRFEAGRDLGSTGRIDTLAHDVLANINAMTSAMVLANDEPAVTIDTILGIHRRLAVGTEMESFAGKPRTTSSWIGGSAHDPCSAAFIPPPPSEVPRLLEDLAAFCNDESLPAVAQAAIAHAQFETIHPFPDGNGRTGRALIHVILRRRGLAPCWCPPVSLVLATLSSDYIRGLTMYRSDGPEDLPEATAGMNAWVSMFARACTRSVHDAMLFERRVREIQQSWRERLGPLRSDSAVGLLIDVLPSSVVITVGQAAEMLGRSYRAANLAVEQLVRAKVLRQINVGKRNRAFEATEIISAFTQLERRLASPAGDTHVAAPVRPVPARHR